MGGGGKRGKQTVGFRYYMSLLMGIGRGPIDELVQIKVGDVNAWPVAEGSSPRTVFGIPIPGTGSSNDLTVVAQGPSGSGVALFEDGTTIVMPAAAINTVSGSATTNINASELFGGDKKEGGVQGSLRVMMGTAAQVVPNSVKSAIGGRVSDMRGVTTLFFDGLLCSINPYPKKWKFRVRRTTSGWDGPVWQPSLATIWMRNGSIKAMNPVHILYECLTNRDWGRGYPRSWLNDTRLTEMAQVLYNENFGLCLRWSRSGELGEFVQMVIDHVGGSLYVDRTVGLISMDLLRADYDVAALPLFTYSSGLLSVENADTAAQEDVINEVIVGWNDPIQDKDRQSRVHNLASLQSMGGGKNSTKKDYNGIPVPELAARVAQRDLKASASSLKRFKVVLDRRAWRIKPGDVFRISAPDKDIYNVIVRAGKTNSGTNTDGKITVEAVIDVFGLPASSFLSEAPIEWAPPSRAPQPADRRMLREATYHDLVRSLGPGDLATVTPDGAAIATLVGKPTDLSQAYNLLTRAEGEDFAQRGSGSFLPTAILGSALSPYANGAVFTDAMDLGLVSAGIPVQIGQEICLLTNIDGEGSMVIERGCVDTIPASHAAGTPIFFLTDEPGSDDREYVNGETVSVKALTYTSSSQLEADLAPTDTLTLAARQGRPWPPANLRVNGSLVGQPTNSLGSNLVFTWAHRDRKIIQDQMIPHGSPSVGPEPGTTYTFRVYTSGTATVPVRTVSGIAAATWTYTNAMAAADGVGDTLWFEVEARRDGMASFQRYRFNLSASFVPVPVDELVVRASNPGGFLFPTGVFTRMPFYTETLDTENAFNTNDRYTVPTAGNYRFTLDVGLDGATTELPAGSTWDLKIDDFTAPTTAPVVGQSASGVYDGTNPIALDVTIALAAGASVSAYLRHNGGADITVASAALEITRLA